MAKIIPSNIFHGIPEDCTFTDRKVAIAAQLKSFAKTIHLRTYYAQVMQQTKSVPVLKPDMIEGVARHIARDFSRQEKMNNIVHNRTVETATAAAAPASVDLEKVKKLIHGAIESAAAEIDISTQQTVSGMLDEVTMSLRDQVLAEAQQAVQDAANKYRKVKIQVNGNEPVVVDDTLPDEFEKIVQLCMMRKPVLLVGPSGCGKTHLAEVVAKTLGLRFSSISCSAGMSESNLQGWLLPVEEGGRFSYVLSQFVDCYENGGVFLLDEMDGSDPNVLVLINQALAQDHFFLPQRHENPRVQRHDDFVLIAAANTFGTGADMMFVGRNQLDAATLDRFRVGTITMDYSAQVEEALCDSEVLQWGRTVRTGIRAHGLQKIMSTRVLRDYSDMKGSGWTMEDIANSYFTDWSEDEKRRVFA